MDNGRTAMILGSDYIETFLTSHHPYDFAREHIIYPRRDLYREHTDSDIKAMKKKVEFARKPIGLKRCGPGLLEFHLRESSKTMKNGFPSWRVESHFSRGEEIERVYGSRWILTTYDEDAFVNFIQVDIDRHRSDADAYAQKSVRILQEAAREYGFDIVWTTSPGYPDADQNIVHGLYAWIRIDQNHFVMDIRPHVLGFLKLIGLDEIAEKHEGAYLSKKKLVRLPGQFNVELADPVSFSKVYQHTPIEASKVFQETWKKATPLKSEILTRIAPPSPRERQRRVCTHSSVTLVPLPPHRDTFESLLKWGRPIVNQVYPDKEKMEECVSSLIITAEKNLPSVSRTRQDSDLLRRKAESIITYLWSNTNAEWAGRTRTDGEDVDRFAPHAAHIQDRRNDLLNQVPVRLQAPASRILDLLLKFNGRVAANQIYHARKTPICTYRNWKIIKSAWNLVTLVEYEKADARDKGTCRQWGFACVMGQDTNLIVAPSTSGTPI